MTSQRVGAISDGAFKVLLGAAFTVSPDIGSMFGVPVWLMVATGSALLIGGTVEIVYARRRSLSSCIRLMLAYDIGWTVATAVALGAAWLGSTAGGEIWAGYQALAAPALAVLLVRAPAGTAPSPDSAPCPDSTASPAPTEARPGAQDTTAQEPTP